MKYRYIPQWFRLHLCREGFILQQNNEPNPNQSFMRTAWGQNKAEESGQSRTFICLSVGIPVSCALQHICSSEGHLKTETTRRFIEHCQHCNQLCLVGVASAPAASLFKMHFHIYQSTEVHNYPLHYAFYFFILVGQLLKQSQFKDSISVCHCRSSCKAPWVLQTILQIGTQKYCFIKQCKMHHNMLSC